jgi:hypothetical protein
VSAEAERVALAALYWVESAGDQVRQIVSGIDEQTRAEACALLADPGFRGQPREQRESRMLDLAGQKSCPAEVA